jgi:hypothetical protein
MSCDNILVNGVKEDIGLPLDTARDDDLDEYSIHNQADTLRLDEIREPHPNELIIGQTSHFMHTIKEEPEISQKIAPEDFFEAPVEPIIPTEELHTEEPPVEEPPVEEPHTEEPHTEEPLQTPATPPKKKRTYNRSKSKAPPTA